MAEAPSSHLHVTQTLIMITSFSVCVAAGVPGATQTNFPSSSPSSTSCGPGYWRTNTTRGCRQCSVPGNPYQEELCPCEATRDAVLGCIPDSNGAGVCTPRATAIDECTRRGYMNTVPSTMTANMTTNTATSHSAESRVLPSAMTTTAVILVQSSQSNSTILHVPIVEATTGYILSGERVITPVTLVALIAISLAILLILVRWCPGTQSTGSANH